MAALMFLLTLVMPPAEDVDRDASAEDGMRYRGIDMLIAKFEAQERFEQLQKR